MSTLRRTHLSHWAPAKVRKDFNGIEYNGFVTEHRGVLNDGSPLYYHVLYRDGDQEDVEAGECSVMVRLYNNSIGETSKHITICGLLHGIFVSAVPLPKEIVFTRAKDVYGCDGPDVGHPFAITFTSNGPS